MKTRYLLLLGIVAGILFFYYNKKEERNLEKHALIDLNLVMTGIVDNVDKLNGYNGTGVIRLKILTSNINSYDPRNDLKYYYCIIRKGAAEIYDDTLIT